MNCKGDEDIDAKRSRPSIGKPASGHARKERVPLIGTDQRITSGPAATMAAFRGRIHDCTRTLRTTVRFPLHRGRRPYMTPSDLLTIEFAVMHNAVFDPRRCDSVGLST